MVDGQLTNGCKPSKRIAQTHYSVSQISAFAIADNVMLKQLPGHRR